MIPVFMMRAFWIMRTGTIIASNFSSDKRTFRKWDYGIIPYMIDPSIIMKGKKGEQGKKKASFTNKSQMTEKW